MSRPFSVKDRDLQLYQEFVEPVRVDHDHDGSEEVISSVKPSKFWRNGRQSGHRTEDMCSFLVP